MAKFVFQPLIGNQAITARLGDIGALFNDQDVSKAVKLVGDSRYDLCAVGNEIEGFTSTVDTATADGYSTGGVFEAHKHREYVQAEGAQVDGTGALAVGDYVVCGTVSARNTAVPANGQRVRKATDQAAAKNSPFAWRVISLGSAGTGAVGTQVLIERV